MLESVPLIIASAKHLSDLATKAENAAIKMATADLVNQASDLKLEAANLKLRLSELTDENRQLKESLKISITKDHQMILREGHYYKSDDDGPFCTGCFDGKNKTIRLQKLSSAFAMAGNWLCPTCQNTFQ